jgi:hypothetical protein
MPDDPNITGTDASGDDVDVLAWTSWEWTRMNPTMRAMVVRVVGRDQPGRRIHTRVRSTDTRTNTSIRTHTHARTHTYSTSIQTEKEEHTSTNRPTTHIHALLKSTSSRYFKVLLLRNTRKRTQIVRLPSTCLLCECMCLCVCMCVCVVWSTPPSVYS